ncbi:hypothetical protein GGTG_11755 [Gaeumannomyces tritici R3-111a-1]|uniref:Uncharacterized protein n=1 Tax=Gaeumannomyces tritici (strain R3-111a-1) TaxID=644352 RepID=J3PE32_GAET3|nr:hypothetical protein GGTG_11755 [Gaeumannomyces tritici R3-111a-1]EJT70732.1 hypothetical protein GGTG_11755 [Gaeumannomyces tritici R3-111a-1]
MEWKTQYLDDTGGNSEMRGSGCDIYSLAEGEGRRGEGGDVTGYQKRLAPCTAPRRRPRGQHSLTRVPKAITVDGNATEADMRRVAVGQEFRRSRLNIMESRHKYLHVSISHGRRSG